MPERVVSIYLFLAVDHVRRRRVLFVDKLGGQVHKDGAPVPDHLFQAQQVYRNTCDIQCSSMSYSLGLVDRDLHSALDRASADEYARCQIQAELNSGVAMRGKLYQLVGEGLANKCSGRYTSMRVVRYGVKLGGHLSKGRL